MLQRKRTRPSLLIRASGNRRCKSRRKDACRCTEGCENAVNAGLEIDGSLPEHLLFRRFTDGTAVVLDLLDSDNERDLILKSDEEIFFTLPGRGHFATDEKPPKKYETVSEIAPWKDWLTILPAMASITSVVSFYLSVPFVSRVTSFPISALMGTYSFMSESAA